MTEPRTPGIRLAPLLSGSKLKKIIFSDKGGINRKKSRNRRRRKVTDSDEYNTGGK